MMSGLSDGTTPGRGAEAYVSEVMRRLGLLVRTERRRRSMSVEALAEKSGVSRSTLLRLESGTGNPSLETLTRLACELGLTLRIALVGPRTP